MTIEPSLKPTSVWQSKPFWCQPWSIALTGFSIIAGSWFWFKLIWLTVLVALPISAWMGFFLLVYPQLMQAHDAYSEGSSSDGSK